jgi:apolipoprotein N-acyltransferase
MNTALGGKRELAGWALAVVSGFMFPLGSPPYGVLWAPWLGVVMALAANRLVTTTRPSVRFALGLTLGMGIGLGAAGWIVELLVQFAGAPYFVAVLGWLAFCLWMAIPYGIWLLLIGSPVQNATRDAWQRILWPSILFCAVHAAWPLVFPYSIIIGLSLEPEWIQLAEVGGVALIELLVVLFAGLVTEAMFGGGPARRNWLLAAAIPLIMVSYGHWRMAALERAAEDAPTLRVGVVQPNIPIGPMSPQERLDRLRSPSEELAELGVDLILWPEAGIYPFRVTLPFTSDQSSGPYRVLKGFERPVLFGAVSRYEAEWFDYNSAYLIDASGRVKGAYDKVKRVIFGEYIPFVDPNWLVERIGSVSYVLPGDEPGRLVLDATPEHPAVSIGPLICLEDIVPSYVREVAQQPGGVDMLVNLTIDSWYGHRVEPWQHLALARFRAVEHRVPLLRSVSAGVSAVVDFTGRLVGHLPAPEIRIANAHLFPPQQIHATVQLTRNTADAPTPYAEFGWLLPHVCQLGVLLQLLLVWNRIHEKNKPTA